MNATSRRVLGGFLLLVMGLSAAYSDNSWGVRDRYPPPAARVAAPAPQAAGAAVALRSLPYWEPVTTLRGHGDATTRPFRIDGDAVQWRVTWSCSEGSMTIRAVRGDERIGRRDLVPNQPCTEQEPAFSITDGELALEVTADGAWTAVVEQQVDRPKVEPPLPAMSQPGAAVVATGSFYDVDRTGRGTVEVHRLPDGRQALRLSDFYVSINSDLEVWLTTAAAPRTTDEAAAARHVSVVALEATAGSMNVVLPDGLDVSGYRSVVIWCEITRNAYAAAALTR